MQKQDAVAIATRFIADQVGPELIHPVVGRLVVEEEYVSEHELAWIVPFNSVAFLEDGDFDKACIPSVIAVPRNGLAAFLPPSSLPVREFLDEVVAGGGDLGEWTGTAPEAPAIPPGVHEQVLHGHLDPETGIFTGGHTRGDGPR
ncbi:YrhB domain-containing protein [Amycolatopsis sp. NPDC051373]|uniref:YrhB domain-containing protein n=1 Tax=Amycolatopsis sp. NPDC051373 TaxID=3155801 RepID=UPI00344BD0B0